MKRRRKSIKLLLSASFVLLGCAAVEIGANNNPLNVGAEAQPHLAHGTGFDKYIGYGYNPAKGVPLVDTANALHYSNPILDVNNEDMWANVNVKTDIDSTRQDSMNFTSSSAVETAETIGNAFSGGISGKVKMVTVNLDSKFEVNRSQISKVQENFSYYSMVVRRRTVALQSTENQLRNYLSAEFLSDAKMITTELAADNFLNKFGSHLLGGYTLGGLLETTNYFSSVSETAARSTSFDLKSEISASLKAVEAGATVAFSNKYGSNYDETTSTNHYHFSAYGGDAFPNLTIDDLFAIKGGEFSQDKNFNYSIWTQSLNEDRNLAIVEVPTGSRMIGVWELLPNTQDYVAAKPHLINAYVKQCANAVRDANYSDLVQKLSLPVPEAPTINVKGYELYTDVSAGKDNSKVLTNYISRSQSGMSDITLRPGQIIAFDFNESAFEGDELEWSVSSAGSDCVDILDSRAGVFKAKNNIDSKKTFTIEIKSAGVTILQIKNVSINPEMFFSGGEGTEDNPYLIANTRDFYKLIKNDENSELFDKHYRLISDLNLNDRIDGESLNPIGSPSNPFTGSFDGDGHSISGVTFDKNNILADKTDEYGGLFGVIDGATIKNLTLSSPKLTMALKESDSDCKGTGLLFAGSLVGYSKGDSSVINCNIDNPNIDLDRGNYTTNSSLIFDNTSDFYVGGVIGRNEGRVDHITINGGTVSAKAGNSSDKARFVVAGGLIGYNGYKTSSVASLTSNIEVKGTTVYAQNGDHTQWEDRTAMTGGLIGVALDCNLSNINIRYDNGGTIQAKTLQDEPAFCGGVLGCLFEQNPGKNNFENIAIKGKSDFINAYYKGNVKERNIGFVSGDVKDASKIQCSNVQADTTNDNLKAFSKGDSDIVPEGYTERNGVKYIAISSMNNDQEVVIDVTNAKTDFMVGEEFSAGSIEVRADDELVNGYWLDYSAYNPNAVGEYEIVVSYKGQTESYKVTVHAAPILSIDVALRNESLAHYEGEFMNIDDFVFSAIYANGTTNEIHANDANTRIIMDDTTDEKLMEGDNIFSFIVTKDGNEFSKKNGKAGQTVVNAKGREFSSIAWVGGEPSFSAYPNTVISSSSLLKGAKFEVNFDKGGKIVYEFVTNNSLTETPYREDGVACKSVQLTRSQANVDVIIPTISLGDNVATICYDDYHTLEFNIRGDLDPNDHTEELNTLRSLVNAIAESKTLIERFQAIKAAKQYFDALTWSSSESNALGAEINDAISAYNNQVAGINDDILESVTISVSINGFSLDRRGLSAWAIILAIAFAI